jgi:hypothetical protein
MEWALEFVEVRVARESVVVDAGELNAARAAARKRKGGRRTQANRHPICEEAFLRQ